MNKSRREFLQRTPSAIGTALFLPSYELLSSSLLDRLAMALTKPSSIDETTLRYLEQRTDSYYQDRHNVSIAPDDVLSYVLDHLQKVTTFLEGSLLPNVRTHLCSIISEIALLTGELLFEMSDYTSAREYHTIAIKAAREANNQVLEAVARGWMSFSWTYSGKTQMALVCVQEARQLATRSAGTTIRSWLAAIEAEAQANVGNYTNCLKALDGAEYAEDHYYPTKESYWIHFDRSLLSGYQGICFLRLSRLEEAQRALKDAVKLLPPTMTRRLPILFTDLADSYVQQREFGEACEYALQALTITAQAKSLWNFQRILDLRNELEAWKDTQYVKVFDEHLRPLLIQGWYRGNT